MTPVPTGLPGIPSNDNTPRRLGAFDALGPHVPPPAGSDLSLALWAESEARLVKAALAFWWGLGQR